MSKKPPDHVTILGPMWQYECERCGHVAGDVYDSKAEAVEAAVEHDCLVDSVIGLRLRRGEDGIYRATIGDPFIGKLLVEATVRDALGEGT